MHHKIVIYIFLLKYNEILSDTIFSFSLEKIKRESELSRSLLTTRTNDGILNKAETAKPKKKKKKKRKKKKKKKKKKLVSPTISTSPSNQPSFSQIPSNEPSSSERISITTSPTNLRSEESDCTKRINFLRSKFDIDPITEKKELHSCVNRQSEFDKQTRAHASYRRCGSTGSQGQGGGSSCGNVIDMFYHERWSCVEETAVFGIPFKQTTDSSFSTCRAACMDDFECKSFDFDGTSENPCRFYNEGSVTHVNEVDGTYWLGATSQTTIAPSIVDSWKSYASIDVDGVNSVPAEGHITSFKWYGSNPDGVEFHFYRLVSGNTFESIGMATVASTNVGQENILEVNPPIPVQKGDVMGWTWLGTAAFGFTKSKIGQVRYKNEESSGGPESIGETWEFDGSPQERRYHVSASFVPSSEIEISSGTRNYCAAAQCNGHCGPVMSTDTKTYAWGEWQGFYTLNWRPGATLPAGNACPSNIEAVKCWYDTSHQILWAYGVAGEDCHSTCSLAGATSADYKCDTNSPITRGFEQVSEIMSHFENPYSNIQDTTNEFRCDTGGCWEGIASHQIMIHEYNSDCYVPWNDEEYSCDYRLGNTNCFGQRFNQVCPCIHGCSWAAGPDCTEDA